MRNLVLLACACFLVSCVHTAIAPVCTPTGEQAVIRIPGVSHGKKATPADLAKVDQKIAKGLVVPGTSNSETPEKNPGSTEIGLIGFYGDVTTKQGERFVGYCPLLVIRSTLPADQVDRAAGVLAAASYRSAKKSFDVRPLSDFAESPKKKP